MDALELTEEQEAELYRLRNFYWREAKRCEEAKAYLAACVMAASTLEVMLILMVDAYVDDALATNKCPTARKAVKPLLEWTLAELIAVAKAANWLPARLELGTEWDGRKAKIGDYAEVVREIRNMVHPARYLEDHYRKRITKKHLYLARETIDAAVDWLLAHVHKRLKERLDSEEGK